MALVSSALGSPYQYRTWFTDGLGFLVSAHSSTGGRLPCFAVGSGQDFSDVMHTQPQAAKVFEDFNAWDLAGRP